MTLRATPGVASGGPGRTRRRVRIAAAAGPLAMVLALSGCSLGGDDDAPGKGRLRTVYLAADETVWDYAPQGRNVLIGRRFGTTEDVFVARSRNRIGRRYLKSVFRAYTDSTFRRPAAVPERWRHLGFLGPVLHAEVGDTIRVVFRNNTRYAANVHPHGARYAKDSEGSPYNDGTRGAAKADDMVAPGKTHTYTWRIPERAGPGPHDPSSVAWMYHGHVDEPVDTNSGLMGTIVVTRRGMARPDGTPKDVDREIVSTFWVVDENHSRYLRRNVRRFTGSPASVDLDDEGFIESNLMHSINGYVYGNAPELRLRRGERVRWYLMAMGTEVDLHTPHWHGNTVTTMGMRADVVQLLPAGMVTADMRPDASGTWLFHCHVNDHISAGMSTRYVVG